MYVYTYNSVKYICSPDLKTDTSTDNPDTDKKDRKTHRHKTDWHWDIQKDGQTGKEKQTGRLQTERRTEIHRHNPTNKQTNILKDQFL